MTPTRPSTSIPQRVKAAQTVLRGNAYAGRVPLTHLPRVKAVTSAPAELDVELHGARDAEGSWLRGHVRGTLTLTCQRGLHPFPWPCDLAVALRLVSSEAEEQQVLKDTEPYLVQDDTLPLRELVEEEVLLALPMQPRCDDPDCAKKSGP